MVPGCGLANAANGQHHPLPASMALAGCDSTPHCVPSLDPLHAFRHLDAEVLRAQHPAISHQQVAAAASQL
eukprot:1341542-Alexandrium_andersonii.AAC.1